MSRHPTLAIDAGGLATLLMIAGLTYVFAVQPTLRARDDRKQDATEQRDAERALAERRAERRRVESELEDIRGKLSADAVALEGAHALNKRVQQITALATETGLVVDGVTPGDVAEGEMFDVIPIEMRGRGSYTGLAGFLHTLNDRLGDTGVTELSVEAQPDGGAVFSVVLGWYTAPDRTAPAS